jgi:hypothetical protein
MDQLIEGVLAICPRLSPVDGAGIVRDRCAIQRHVLAVALHRQLLEICGEPLEVLLVRQDSNGLSTEEVVVPNTQKAQDHWKIFFEGRGSKMLIHLMKAVEHRPEIIGADGKHGGKADG